ncbi:MAG: hypothetical protein ACJ74H_11195 [Thermoanaerobaculia bacterium]
MPKIRDLGISTIAYHAAPNRPCASTIINPPQPNPNPCAPSAPQCHPTNKPKYARSLPPHAVIQLREQLHHHIGT